MLIKKSWQLPSGKKFRRTTIVFVLSLAFLIGVALAKSGVLIDYTWALLAGLMALIFLRRQNWLVLVLIILFGLSLGWWRGSVYMQRLTVNKSHYFQKITVLATAADDATYGQNQQIEFEAENAAIEGSGQKLTGKIKLAGFGTNMVYAGDRVKVTGKLYPALGNNQAQIS
ncbi:MAG: DUF4131 domain-containing protein, partial [Candidatus Saccharimonadales bacterium]